MTVPDDAYTHGHHEAVLRSHRWRTVENSAGYLLPHLRPGLDVLDIGCGPGTITTDLAARVHPGRVLGIDRAPEVIEVARAAAGDPAPTFAVGDVYLLDHDDASFDVVHAHQVLQHLSDPVAALREMRRVCRPDGVVAVRDSDYAAFAWAPADPRLERWRDAYRGVARAHDAEPDAGRHLLGWVRRAGLQVVETNASAWCFATAEDRAWWGGLWADRMRESDIGARAVELGLLTRAEVDDVADAFTEWADHADGWFAVLHGEVVARP